MPQLAFLQAIVVAAIVAFALIVLAFPAAAKLGWRAGRTLLRVAVGGLLLAIVVCLVWASQSGELERFSSELGADAALQIGVFMLIMLGTGFNFASRYVAEKAREEAGTDA